ncbi:MAG TPA: pyruvate carboxylase, partial [Candidatus Rothia avistercoris]|nr:pyruvate carboxylase [Candidatus Rothia avistercoris]
LHTHDTAGGQVGTLLAAVEAGVDVVDVASASMAGTTSQPSFSALVGALQYTDRAPSITLEAACALEPYWEAVRTVYKPFEMGLSSPTGRVYTHEIPGGQLSNLRAQATALGLGERFEDIEDMYAAADRMLGHIVKVTPSSKVVGDLALQLVGMGVSPEDFEKDPQKFDIPDSVIGFLNGELGTPPAGWPEPFRTRALEGRKLSKPSVNDLSAEDLEALNGDSATRRATLNRLLFAGPTRDFEKACEEFGDLSILHTRDFLYGMMFKREHVISLGKGVRLIATLQAISEPDEKGMREVICTLNGQQRTVNVRDTSVESNVKEAEKADASNPGHIAAPFAGGVSISVKPGDEISAGDQVATIEAMKMEASITSAVSGTVERVVYNEVSQVAGGDLLIVVNVK